MRILNVNATLDPVWGGGGAERTRRLSSALARLGHDVTVLTISMGSGISDLLNVEGAEVVALKCLNKRFMVPLLPVEGLRRLICDHDIVHLNGHWTILNAVMYLLTRIERKPYAVSPVGTLPLFGRSQKLKSVYNAIIGYSLIQNARAHIAVTPSEVFQFENYGVASSNISVIPNGVDVESFAQIDSSSFRERHSLTNAPFILFMGRLNPIKGPDLLLEAFTQVAERFSAYLLVFAGPNEGMEAGLLEVALRHGISDRVRFIGHVGGEEKTAAYRAATLLVIPSRMEAMSIVVLEGGAAGLPVLITDQCGFDMVEEIGGGRVVKAEASAIAEGLDAMLTDVSNLPNAGQRLRNLVHRDFTWDAAASRLSVLFATVLGEGRG
jgi:glycosyltransferase involved in cell wall biosynthesis